MSQASAKTYKLAQSSRFEKILKNLKSKKPAVLARLDKQIAKIMREPNIGKPLRNVLRNRRRIHVDSFVLIYEVYQDEIRLLDFDHHNRIYKKY